MLTSDHLGLPLVKDRREAIVPWYFMDELPLFGTKCYLQLQISGKTAEHLALIDRPDESASETKGYSRHMVENQLALAS